MEDGEAQCEQFFIFSPSLCAREGEEAQKIVYFYPASADLNSQVKSVGLAEAVVRFTSDFSDQPVRCLTTLKSRQVFLEPEPGYWFVMRFTVPKVPLQQRPQQQAAEAKEDAEYLAENVQDVVCQELLHQAYLMYRLFKGSIRMTLERGNVEILRQKCNHFFSRYLADPTHSCFSIYQSTLLEVYRGVTFLPLSKRAFLQVHCLVQRVQAAFPRVRFACYLHSDQLVWTSLHPTDTRCVYAYLVHSLFPRHAEDDLRNLDKGMGSSGVFGRFITGPPNLDDPSQLGSVPRLFLTGPDGGSLAECHMLVYRSGRSSLCLFVDAGDPVTYEQYVALDRLLQPLMRRSSDTVQSCSQQLSENGAASASSAGGSGSGNDSHIRFLYFNHMNSAQKSTVFVQPEGSKRPGVLAVKRDLMRLCADVHADHCRHGDLVDTETVAKTTGDAWLVAKKFDRRDFFALVTQFRPANLILVTEEVSRLCQAQFHSILFIE